MSLPPPVPSATGKSGLVPIPLNPPMHAPGRTPAVSAVPKRTILGVPAPTLKPSAPPLTGDPTRSLVTPISRQSDIARGMSPQSTPNIQMDDWDDEEPPTNIYSKEAAKEMAKASLAMKATQEIPQATSGMNMGMGMGMGSPFIAPPPGPIVQPRRPVLPILLGLLLAVAILGILALFFVGKSKTTIELHVEPPDLKALEVIVDGVDKLPSNMSPIRTTLEPGDHTFTIRHEGFKDKTINVTLKAGEEVLRSVTLENSSTGFFIESDPPGATIFVNEKQYEEKTPTTISDLQPGTYSVRLEKGEDYQPKTLEVEVVSGAITPLPKKVLDLRVVEVVVMSSPSEAKAVLIGDNKKQDLGKTPATCELDTSKEYKIRFEKDGYEDTEQVVEFKAGESKITIDAELTPKKGKGGGGHGGGRPQVSPVVASGGGGGDGALSIQTKPWSKVFVNNRFIKNTPLVNYSLSPGTYTVTVENPDFNIKKNFKVRIQSGKTTTLVKTLIGQ